MSTWAVVEIMGHRKRAGRVSEATRFGAVGMQLEIPRGDGFVTEFYSGPSIFAVRECTEEEARSVARVLSPEASAAPLLVASTATDEPADDGSFWGEPDDRSEDP